MRQQRHILFYMPDFYGHLVPLLLRNFMCKTDYIHYEKPLYYLPIFQFMYLLLSVTTVVKMKEQGKLINCRFPPISSYGYLILFIWLWFVSKRTLKIAKKWIFGKILYTFVITTGSKTRTMMFWFNKHFFILPFVHL